MSRLQQIKPWLCSIGGAAILAFGLYHVHAQSAITEGGVLGATLLIHHWLGISPAISETVLDILCYFIGFKAMGGGFAKQSAAATLSFALFYRLFECFPPLFPTIGNYPLEAAVLGALFVGLGTGITVRSGAAASGDDALAMTIARGLHIPITFAYMATDLTVLALSLTYIPFSKIVYSLVTVTLSSVLIGLLQRVGKKPKAE